MLQPVNYAQLLFPDFSLILIGFLVCRFTALNRSVWGQIDAVVYYLLFPVLLFHSIVKSPLDLGTASPLIFAGWALCLSGIAMAYALPYLPWIGARIDRRGTHGGSGADRGDGRASDQRPGGAARSAKGRPAF